MKKESEGMCLHEIEEQEFQKALQFLRKQIWLDWVADVLGEDIMCSVNEEKLFEIIRSKNWMLCELEQYLLMHFGEFMKSDK